MQTIIKPKTLTLFLVCSLVVLLSSCLNQYEKDTLGFYKVGQYELIDSAKELNYDLPTLTVKADKTFSIDFNNRKIEGKWKADDYGDWTLIDFYFNGQDVQGQIGIDEIAILNPRQFDCPFLKKLVFKRTKKDTNN